MIKILAVAALATAVAMPASAQSIKARGSDPAMLSYAQSSSKSKAKRNNRVVTADERYLHASPSGNPEWDVYVRGEYVGSDPDPRIRWSLRREAVRNYGLRGN